MEQTVRVAESGNIQLSLIGEVHVASMTTVEAAHQIESILLAKNLMKYPSVTVSVNSYETENVSVSGQVNHAGAVQVTTPRSAIDLITLCGGLTDYADRHILIRRKGSNTDTVSFYYSNDPATAIKNDVQVNPGDTVMVPKVGIVYVLGDVGRPGGFPITSPDSRMTVLEAVSLAGATNHTATPSNARLVRKTADGYQDIHLQISKMQKGKEPDMDMRAGDVIYIPFSYLKNALSLGSSSIFSSAVSAAIYTH
jgi:polysaccharide export outer membrane protein